MKKTHKFRALSGEAAAVIAAAPSLTVAARQLGVDRSTIHRWLQVGKVARPARRPRHQDPKSVGPPQSPEAWAMAVRAAYALTDTESALLDLAEEALCLARDQTLKPEVRLSAAGRFQQLVKQLDFEESIDDGKAEATRTDTGRWPRRVG